MSNSQSGRIAKNTLILYGRMLLTVGVSLYTVRVVLNTLGVEDYGLYNVVGGVVGLLAFVPNAMASATQRYFAHAMGKQDRDGLKKIFTVNWTLYVALALLALVALETVGAWFVADIVKIPADRYDAALVLYRTSAWAFVFGLVTAPSRAVIIAHEEMHIFAAISVFEVVLKLIAVLGLTVWGEEKLVLYGYLVLAVSVVVAGAYTIVCVRRYEECRFGTLTWDVGLLREVLGFTGWTLFGQLTTVFRNQAVTILLNQTFTPVVVAARSIALNTANQANVFAGNFNTSLYPPIIKTYAAGELREMHRLVFNGSKMSFFLMWLLALPLLMEMPLLLALWLKAPPPDAVLFTRLALIDTLLNALSLPLMTAARAPGKMRTYELSLGSGQLAIFVGSWAVLKSGGAAFWVFVVAIAGSATLLFLRLAIVGRLTGLPFGEFIQRVLIPVATVTVLSLVPAWLLKQALPEGAWASVLGLVACAACNGATVFLVGLTPEMRARIKTTVATRCGRLLSAA